MLNVFISRALAADSTFGQQLTAHGIEVHAQSLVAFHPVQFGNVPEAEWLFFYSKKAVTYFFENAASTSPQKLAAIGPGTAKAIAQYQKEVDFVGNGNPEETATAFLQVARGCKVLFPQAENSRRSIQRLLKGKIIGLDLVVYQNRALIDFDIPQVDCLVFTSPLNTKAYFSRYTLETGQQLIAIGPSTAEALRKLGHTDVLMAEEPTEEALAKAVLRALIL